MDLSALFTKIRAPYVANFELLLRGLHAERILVEPAPRAHDGQPVRDGPLGLSFRVDSMLEVPEGLTPFRCMTPARVRFPAIEQIDDRYLAIHPFEWFSCPVRVGTEGLPDWSRVVAWFEAAFAGDDSFVHPRDARPRGLVHYLGDPRQRSNGAYDFEVDFGTAPISVALEFVEALRSSGFEYVRLGNEAATAPSA